MTYKLGIDIGGTKVNMGILDENNKIISKSNIKLPENKDYKYILSVIKANIDSILAENKISTENISSCGIGIPGTVSKCKKIAVKVPNIGWENINLADEFYKLTGIPSSLVQDSRAAALGEFIAGGGQGCDVVVCVTLGTGIGTGIIINGEIFDGGTLSAGEIGHIPVKQDGRECGCGKKGCLEKYAAGIGFDITAKELYGENAMGREIFTKAENGDETAKEAIADAVIMLGNAMVSIVNLLSPDCLLFSGGLSKEEKLIVNPLISYINKKCYKAQGKEIKIGLAKLGEDSPMIGAALLNLNEKKCEQKRERELILSASIMCADMMNFGRDLKEIADSGIKYLHCDVMDGHFVPNLMLSIEMINNVRKNSDLPFDIHLMVEKPENIIPLLNIREGDIVSVHFESTPHVKRALSLISETGATAAIAINPSTPIESIRECLFNIGMVLVMTVNPGFAGQKLVSGSIDKITRVRKYLDDLGYNNMPIEVDGNCSFENVPKMFEAGADIFVVGTSSVFNPQKHTITEGVNKLFSIL